MCNTTVKNGRHNETNKKTKERAITSEEQTIAE